MNCNSCVDLSEIFYNECKLKFLTSKKRYYCEISYIFLMIQKKKKNYIERSIYKIMLDDLTELSPRDEFYKTI